MLAFENPWQATTLGACAYAAIAFLRRIGTLSEIRIKIRRLPNGQRRLEVTWGKPKPKKPRRPRR